MLVTLPDKPKSKDLVAFQKATLECLKAGQPLIVGAGEVSQLPLAWIQILISASREAALRGGSMTIVNPSFAFLFSFEALGLRPEQDLFTLEYGP